MFLPECYGTIDNPGNVTFFFFQYLSNFASEGEESRARLKDSGDGEARIDEGNLFQLQTVLGKKEYL